MAKILCIEDSREFQIFLQSSLAEHSLTFSSTISDSLRILEKGRNSFELILLDISLPDGNGVRLLPKLLESVAPKQIPIIVVSGDGDLLTKIAAFGMGADDYLIKPFDANELKARIAARLRWVKSDFNEKASLEYGNLAMDRDRMVAEIILPDGGREPLNFSPLEFKILRLLITRAEQVFSRDQIIEKVWGAGTSITARTVDTHISHIRQKISQSSSKITTVMSSGYKIEPK